MIVDDDEILREGIEKTPDWSKNNILVVGTARNGRECLKIIPDCLPQIILTDIKMPFMDGMQLCEAVFHLYPSIRLVLLTAYDDFAYAKKALDYKVTEYVMKYEDNAAIIAAVKKAALEYDRQKTQTEIIRSSRRLLTNKFFKDWVLEGYSEEKIDHCAKQLDLSFPYLEFQVLSFRLMPACCGDAASGRWRMEQYQQQFGNLFADCAAGDGRKVFYFLAEDHLNVLLNFDGEIKSETLLQVIKSVEDVLKIGAAAGIGRKCQKAAQVPQSYREAVQALEYQSIVRNKDGGQPLVYFNDTVASGNLRADVIRQITAFIRQHYMEKTLSLNVIANAVHLTPSYVSAVFKKNFKINITDYLTRIRLEKAKELLEKTDFKTYEVSERVGYSNSQYFSVLFKRIIGVSPTEYRQKASLKEKEHSCNR